MKGAVVFMAGALAALGAGWAGFPRVIYKSKPQPVDFSHKIHAEKAGTNCEDCHAFRDDGSYSGIPRLEKCTGCHAAPMGTSAAEKAFIETYVTPNREPEWAPALQGAGLRSRPTERSLRGPLPKAGVRGPLLLGWLVLFSCVCWKSSEAAHRRASRHAKVIDAGRGAARSSGSARCRSSRGS